MRVVVVTSEVDTLGAVFADAYRRAGGPAPVLVVVLPERGDLRYPFWARGWVALRLFGVAGTLRLLSARLAELARHELDEKSGLIQRWPAALRGPETIVADFSTLGPEARDTIAAAAPDVLVSIGAPVIIDAEILKLARIGAVNVHNGRLPAYRGHFGSFWEVLHDEEWAHVSIHEMSARVDGGRVLVSHRLRIGAAASFLDLLIAKKRIGGQLLACLLSDTETRGALPEAPTVAERPTPDRYFGWPSLTDIGSFRWQRTPKPRRLGRALKRSLDLMGALGGIVMLAPVLATISITIKAVDGGPILYRGVRVGRHGRPFHILKFRTMVVDAEQRGPSSTASDDARITRIGDLLRRVKLDELPQFYNVLIGHMSLVGPRPQVPWAVAHYTSEQRSLLDVRPGITDFASLVFANEAELLRGSRDPDRDYVDRIAPEKIRLGLAYVRNWSLALDVRIILATLCRLCGLRWRWVLPRAGAD